jgi:aspartyl protease family protein
MRAILVVAAILAGLGIAMGKYADRVAKPSSMAAEASAPRGAVVRDARVSTGAGRSVTIHRDKRGHFQTEARVDGGYIGFMVDTGASVVALTERDAERIGVRPSRGDFTASVSTANGVVMAARARLASIDVGGLVIRDVDALILPDTALRENLLGLSFLSRLKRFEYADGKLVLEQ